MLLANHTLRRPARASAEGEDAELYIYIKKKQLYWKFKKGYESICDV